MKKTKLVLSLLILVAFAAGAADAQTKRRRRPVRQTAAAATTTSPVNSTRFLVPSGTSLVGVLNENLSIKNARERDRFTLTVREPSQYDGATLEGYLTGVQRSGKIKGRSQMTLNFDRIVLRNGDSYRFAGITTDVRSSDGDSTRVDNEGNIERSRSQTRKTGERAAIGTGAGAVIGAIAGGGKGAAIGAIVGGGAGAGSVLAQGKQNLELDSGTEITVRATGPRGR